MGVIVLGSPTGGGARLVGPMVAQKLGADYVDRIVLQQAARRLGTTVGALQEKEDRPPLKGGRFSQFLQRALARSATAGGGLDGSGLPFVPSFLTEEYDAPSRLWNQEIALEKYTASYQPTATKGSEVSDEKYVEALRIVMEDLAERGNVVIVGRGGPMILGDTPEVLRVGVIANRPDCVTRIMERENLTSDQATKTVIDRDDARAYYLKRFFGVDDPNNPKLYHLMINTSDVSLEYAVDLVIHAAGALEEGKLT